MATETRDVLVKVEIDRKGADKGLGAIKNKGEQATKSLKDTKKAADNTGKSMTGLAADTKIMGVSVNSLSAGFTSMRAVIGKAIVSLKIFKTALISTGIGALVIAAGALIVFLTRMQSGMDIVSKAMAQLGAVVDVVLDRLGNLGKVIISFGKAVVLALKGDFVGAMEAAKEAGEGLKEVFSGIGEEIAADVKLAGDLADALVKLEEQEISNIAVQAERRRDIAKLLLLVKDETKSAKERLKAAQDAAGLERAILEENIRLQTERVRIAKLEFDRSESSREDARAFAGEQAKLFQLEENSLKKLRAITLETLKFQRLVIKEAEEFAGEKKINDEFEELKNAQNFEFAMVRIARELEAFKLASLGKVEINQQLLDEIDQQNEDQAEKNIARAERNAEAEKRIGEARAKALIGFAQQTLAAQESLGRVGIVFSKSLALTEIGFATRRAAIHAYDAALTLGPPGLILAPIVAAIAVAFGLAQAAAVAGVTFARGGKIKARGAPSSGDRVLIRANPGEVVLNDQQQARLGGDATFRRIGVPGFQGGGVVPAASIGPNITGELDSITNAIRGMKIVTTIEDINEGQERVATVENKATISSS